MAQMNLLWAHIDESRRRLVQTTCAAAPVPSGVRRSLRKLRTEVLESCFAFVFSAYFTVRLCRLQLQQTEKRRAAATALAATASLDDVARLNTDLQEALVSEKRHADAAARMFAKARAAVAVASAKSTAYAETRASAQI